MMDLPRDFQVAVEEALGVGVQAASQLSGGDINAAYRLTLADGRDVFAKTHPQVPAGAFEAEAAGLRWLEQGGARCPRVLASSKAGSALGYLLMEYVRPSRAGPQSAEGLGVALARLHASADGSWGWDRNNWIGSLHQDNRACTTWCDFYWRRRIEPQLRQAVQSGKLSDRTRAEFRALEAKIVRRVEPESQPARLHGDLWSGNCLWDSQGRPVLIDPACYRGSPEVDLAMMRLFGGFSEATFSAYAEVSPLPDGHADRVSLYQLYPLLVHVNLLGASYVSQLTTALWRVV